MVGKPEIRDLLDMATVNKKKHKTRSYQNLNPPNENLAKKTKQRVYRNRERNVN